MFRPVLILLVLMSIEQIVAQSFESCPFNFYDPCRCQRSGADYYITCYSVPADQIRAAFERSNVTDHYRLYIHERNSTVWPADLLAGKRVDGIAIMCEGALQLQHIDVDAFRSSENFTTFVWLDSCDLTSPEFDFYFLSNFNVLDSMEISAGGSSVFPPMPLLPKLSKLHMRLSSGLRQWYQPEQTPALNDIRLFNIGASSDEPINAIMQSLAFYNDTLEKLDLEYVGLTRIPAQIRWFTRLHSLTLRGDSIATLWPGDLVLHQKMQVLDLGSSSIGTIEPGAIQADLSSSGLNLLGNRLNHFKEKIFRDMLLSMAQDSGAINLFNNQIICDCDLAWLICDYRNLLPYAVGGSCVNGTSFNTLSPYGFRSCLSSCNQVKPTVPSTTSGSSRTFHLLGSICLSFMLLFIAQ